ncbi:Multi antimicrobial extrusion protein [Parasponia andersonii]|uniref:Multi antimicrobial extrusion protein n=1 Tax=Parasponia andersonii TaxID=3476 RepID=A0A2P5DF07_PARAD|nr:Multi antimicrobial extrusion protein [Parasponia andersonii]
MERDNQTTITSNSLNSPLILIETPENNINGFNSEKNGEKGTSISRSKEVSGEVKRQLWLAGPIVVVSLVMYFVQVISVMFVGHLGDLTLSGASMATSFASVTGFSLLDPEISAAAGLYARNMIPMSHQIPEDSEHCLPNDAFLCCHILTALLCMLDSDTETQPGLYGSCFGQLNLVVDDCPAVRILYQVLGIMRKDLDCFEICSFEMMVLLSGLLPNPKLETSVLSIWKIDVPCSLNTSSIVWMIPTGVSRALSTRVSNELGAGNSRAARLAVHVVLFMAISEGLLVGLLMILVRNVGGRAYSSDERVVRYVAVMMPILATSNLVDDLQGVCLFRLLIFTGRFSPLYGRSM